MEPKVIELTNGANLSVSAGSFKDATSLKTEIMDEITKQGFDLSSMIKGKKDVSSLMKKEMNTKMIVGIITPILAVENSEVILDKVLACASKCLYNKEKITIQTFDDPDTWPVLVEIKIEIVKANVLPFFQNLPSIVQKLFSNINLDTVQK